MDQLMLAYLTPGVFFNECQQNSSIWPRWKIIGDNKKFKKCFKWKNLLAHNLFDYSF